MGKLDSCQSNHFFTAIPIHVAGSRIDLDDHAIQVTNEEPIIGSNESTVVQCFLLAYVLLSELELVYALMHLLHHTAKALQQASFD
jgi:hypothetical protein